MQQGQRAWRPRAGVAPGAWVVLVVAVLVVVLPLLVEPGYVLRYDAVWVPRQDLLPWMWGAGTAPPRSVPQDAVVAVIDGVVPGTLLWRLVLVAALLLAGVGAARLVPERAAVQQAVTALACVWSPFVAERMLIGHWGLLLTLAALPWVLAAADRCRRGCRGAWRSLVLWTAVGSMVPSGGLLLLLAAALALAWPGAEARGRSRVAAGLGVLLVQACWIVPALLRPGTGQAAAALFGLRPEGHLGAWLTALTTGGVWSSELAPPTRGTWWAVLGAVAVLGVALVGARGLRSLDRAVLGPLGVLAVAGLAWAVLTAVPWAAGQVDAVTSLPGGGLLRDGHKWLLPWTLLLALALGSGAQLLRDRAPAAARGPIAALLVLLPVLALPDLAWSQGGRLAAVEYPGDWTQVRQALEEQPGGGDVLSLPLSAFRAFAWNERRTSLDHAPRFLPRTVVADDRLAVGTSGGLSVLPGDDPRAAAAREALAAPDPSTALRSLGIGYLLVAKLQPALPLSPSPDRAIAQGRVLVDSPEVTLLELPGPVTDPAVPGRCAILVGWAATLLTVLAAAAGALLARIRGRRPPVDAVNDSHP